MRLGLAARADLQVTAFDLSPRILQPTDVTYIVLPGIGDTGDRIIWYRRQ